MLKSLKERSFLLALPLLIYTLSNFFLHDLYYYFMSWPDPVYCYLLNGLNLASGHLEIGHIDHPGTPLHLLMAVIIKITYWILGNENNIVKDVLIHPERYIHIGSQILVLMNCSLCLVLGNVVYKKSGSAVTALAFQLSTLLSFTLIAYSINLMTEPIVVFCGLLFVINYYKYAEGEVSKRIPYILSLIAGCSLATKFSSFPALIVPLFILSNKDRLKYCLTTPVVFVVFTLPIINKYNYFFGFIYDIITHTGAYGAGAEGIIDLTLYFKNLAKLFTREYIFTFTYGLSVLTIFLFARKHHDDQPIDTRYKKLLWGLFTAITIQIIITAKHYSYHYLIPVNVYLALVLYLVFKLNQSRLNKFFIGRSFARFPLAILTTFIVLLVSNIIYAYNFFPNIKNPRRETLSVIEQYKALPRLIITVNAAATPEPALYFGLAYSGEMRQTYEPVLDSLYPNSFMYFIPEKRLQKWGGDISAKEIASKHPEFLLYNTQNNDSIANVVIHLFEKLKKGKQLITIKELYNNKGNHEKIYLITSDTSGVKALSSSIRVINCTMENIDKENKFISTDSLSVFLGGERICSEQKHGGNNSIKLTADSPYGMNFDLKVRSQYIYEISVWRNSKELKGALVACSGTSNDFYRSAEKSVEKKGEWERLSLNIEVPAQYNDSTLKIYLWNTGKGNVYFDDIQIKELEK
jgi:hypothetical protein